MDRNLLQVEFRCRRKNVVGEQYKMERLIVVVVNLFREAKSNSSTQSKTAKDDFDSRKAGLSVPLRKVIQEIPQDSATAKSMQQMNNKDLDFNFTVLHSTTWTSLHTI